MLIRCWPNSLFRSSIIDRSISSLSISPKIVTQKFDYFLVLDFEATCDANKKVNPQEIIEFPCLKFNTKTLTVDSTFHRYVRPDYHPILSPFCTELTGIVQDMVDDKPNLVNVLEQFDSWLVNENLKTDSNQNPKSLNWTFVTLGEWDLKTLLPKQAEFMGVHLPSYFNYWINVHKPVFKCTKLYPRGLMQTLQVLNLSHQGRHHSGIDDTKNIANIVKTLCERGIIFELTSKLE